MFGKFKVQPQAVAQPAAPYPSPSDRSQHSQPPHRTSNRHHPYAAPPPPLPPLPARRTPSSSSSYHLRSSAHSNTRTRSPTPTPPLASYPQPPPPARDSTVRHPKPQGSSLSGPISLLADVALAAAADSEARAQRRRVTLPPISQLPGVEFGGWPPPGNSRTVERDELSAGSGSVGSAGSVPRQGRGRDRQPRAKQAPRPRQAHPPGDQTDPYAQQYHHGYAHPQPPPPPFLADPSDRHPPHHAVPHRFPPYSHDHSPSHPHPYPYHSGPFAYPQPQAPAHSQPPNHYPPPPPQPFTSQVHPAPPPEQHPLRGLTLDKTYPERSISGWHEAAQSILRGPHSVPFLPQYPPSPHPSSHPPPLQQERKRIHPPPADPSRQPVPIPVPPPTPASTLPYPLLPQTHQQVSSPLSRPGQQGYDPHRHYHHLPQRPPSAVQSHHRRSTLPLPGGHTLGSNQIIRGRHSEPGSPHFWTAASTAGVDVPMLPRPSTPAYTSFPGVARPGAHHGHRDATEMSASDGERPLPHTPGPTSALAGDSLQTLVDSGSGEPSGAVEADDVGQQGGNGNESDYSSGTPCTRDRTPSSFGSNSSNSGASDPRWPLRHPEMTRHESAPSLTRRSSACRDSIKTEPMSPPTLARRSSSFWSVPRLSGRAQSVSSATEEITRRSARLKVRSEPIVSLQPPPPPPLSPSSAQTAQGMGVKRQLEDLECGVGVSAHEEGNGGERRKWPKREGEKRREQNAVAQKRFRRKKKEIAQKMQVDLEEAQRRIERLEREKREKEAEVERLRGENGVLKDGKVGGPALEAEQVEAAAREGEGGEEGR